MLAGLVLVLTVAATAGSVDAATELNRVVLRVNDRIATLVDYEATKQERLAALSRSQLPEAELQQQLATLGVSVMKALFEEMLVLSRADQLGLRAEESDIQRSIEQTKQGFGIQTEEDFERALAANGLTRESFRAQIENNILIRQVMGRDVYSTVAVEEEDLRRYYQQNADEFRLPARRQLREVVVLESQRSADDLAMSADELRAKLLGEEADSAVAASEASGVSSGWIDLGWLEIGDLDPDLEASLEDLAPGEVSVPTPGRGGLHIIQVVDFKEPTLRAFAEVSDAIEAQLTDERFEKALEGYMRDLEAKAYVESDPPPEAAGFRGGGSLDQPRSDLLEAGLGSAAARVEEALEASEAVADETAEETAEETEAEKEEEALEPPR